MKRLQAIQSDISGFLREDLTAAEAHIVGDAKGTARRRLLIYATAYRLRLLDALETDYPGVRARLGEDAFRRMGLAYIERHPSTHPSIRWFGARVPDFLEDTDAYADDPRLAELARFEWTQSEVFDDTNAEVTDGAELAGLAPEEWPVLRFRLIPAQRRLRLHADIPPLWQTLTEGVKSSPGSEASAEWLLWRADLDIRWRSLGMDEAWALDAVAGGAPFSDLCEGLCQWHPPEQAPTAAIAMLKRWLEDGLIHQIVSGWSDAFSL